MRLKKTVNEKLRDYVTNAKQKGFDDNKIKKSLIGAGWPEEAVTEALEGELIPPKPDLPAAGSNEKQVPVNNKTNVLAIVSFIFSFLIWPIGLILGIIALVQINKKNEGGKGLAIAAIILSSIGFIFSTFMLIPLFAFFGVLNPNKVLPDRCQFSAGMDCTDKAIIAPDSIEFVLRNNIGYSIKLITLESPQCSGNNFVAIGSNAFTNLENTEIQNNQIFRVKLDGCNNGKKGATVNTDITLTYYHTGTETQKDVTGNIRGTVN